MNALQDNLECWLTAVAYANAGQFEWMDELKPVRSGHSTAALRLMGFGLGSVLCYVAAFAHADSFAALCAQGGWWSALPLGAVLALSYVHGHFADALWELCGINGIKKQAAQQEAPVAASMQRGAAHTGTGRLTLPGNRSGKITGERCEAA